MNLLSLLPGFSFFRLGIVAVALVGLTALWWKDRHDYGKAKFESGKAEIQSKWNDEKSVIAKQTLRVYENNTRKEYGLIDFAEATRRTKDARIAQIDANLTIALNGLRDRPDRPSRDTSVPTIAGTGTATGCTGAELFRPDSEFLTRLGARANETVAALAQCQAQYEAARLATQPPK